MANGRTNDNLDDALERDEARILAHVARTQGVRAAHRLSTKQLRDRVMSAGWVIALLMICAVWFSQAALWIKWLVSGLAALPLVLASVLARKNSQQLDEERERQLREHRASPANQDAKVQ